MFTGNLEHLDKDINSDKYAHCQNHNMTQNDSRKIDNSEIYSGKTDVGKVGRELEYNA